MKKYVFIDWLIFIFKLDEYINRVCWFIAYCRYELLLFIISYNTYFSERIKTNYNIIKKMKLLTSNKIEIVCVCMYLYMTCMHYDV